MAGTGSLHRNNLLPGQNGKADEPQHTLQSAGGNFKTIPETEAQQKVAGIWTVH